ncbi:cobyrinic acid a,c-diamide synthase [Methanocaldococcus villosus KIN24-T80]|uniref:Cobyrinic acid a,c-diamide synthase n=1 Tax=Methanocaldococcus villosus KIN24-T80 TaxID=1069083 RepID=N6V1Y2_9EURY|nr:AAA family ATPase [Methanocaldococcus villosus]ENN96298.1 cobyrinic acid a,c-diamide synthase [Methanocaldococcus villosus KIN24-T80]
MDIGILDIKGALPLFEDFGNLPTKIIDEKNYKEIRDLLALIIPGGSLVESRSFPEEIKREIIDFDGYIIGICSGFQILGKRVDVGRKSHPKIIECLGLLDVEFSPLVCTDRVKFKINNKVFGSGIGEGFHCHTYGNIKILDKKTEVLTVSEVEKLNYKINKKEIISGAFKGKVFGTMVHNFLDNLFIRDNFLNYLNITDEEREEIFEKNKLIKEELKKRALIYKINKKYENNGVKKKRGILILSTSSNSGKTFLTTAIVSKLCGKVFVAKIGGDVRDIVPSLYLIREPMTKYNSIRIGKSGWVSVEEFVDFIKNSNYDYIIIEGVMGAFTGAMKGISSYQIARKLNFPVYIVATCNLSGIEGAFVEALSYYFILKDILDVKGIILNRVYDFNLFEKLKNLAENYGVKLYAVEKVDEKNIPEIEIDYESFCLNASKLNINIEIPEIEIKLNEEEDNFLLSVEKFIRRLL